jgi:Concanavalin A-like lectin/glucanases superfamily/Alginate lyase
VSQTSVDNKKREDIPDSARRALALGLGLFPMLPLLPGCGVSTSAADSTSSEQGQSTHGSAPDGSATGTTPPTPGAAPAPAPPTPASVSGVFRHPGLLVTEDDFARIRQQIAGGQQPWTTWWNTLRVDRLASLDAKPNALPAVFRADSSKFAMYRDIQRAWCLGLCWRLSGDTRYADKAVETLDAWATTLKMVGTVPEGSTAHDDHTFILLAGMQGHQWAQAGEILRGYPGWAPESLARFQQMLLTVFASISSSFISTERLHSHANWDMASMCGTLAIGVFCDRPDLYRQACDYYAANNRGKLQTFGNGSIVHSVYFMHPGHLGQWEESGRDQGHSTLGMSLGGDFLEMAWNQGDDLYGLYNNRFLAAAEYVARSNLLDENGKTYPMPYAPEQDPSQPHTSRWTQVNQSFQHYRDAWEPIYNHYVNRMGLAAPNVARMLVQTESNYLSSGGDDMVYPTLTQRRPAYAGAMKPPSGLTASVRDGQVVLSWWGSVGATSYVVARSASSTGPFADLATISASELLTHSDTPPSGTWFYRVAIPGAGSSGVVRAAVGGEQRLSMPLNDMNGTATSGSFLSPAGSRSTVQATLLDAAAWADGRRNDKAIAFDGKASGLQLPPGIFAGLDDFSISLWAYANGLHVDSCLFFAGNDGFSSMRIAPQASNGRLRFGIAGAGFNDEQSMDAPNAMPIRRWVHLAVTLQGSSARLYLDGQQVASADDILLTPRQVGDQVAFLGRNWAHPPFNGRIQDFRVHAGALSAADVLTLAQS